MAETQTPDTTMPRGVIAHLTPSDAAAAADFYVRAFGAVEASRMPGPGGKLMHVHLKLNDGVLLLADHFENSGHPNGPPQAISLLMVVDDIDSSWKRAIDAGGEPMMEPQVMFWGDRYAQFRDPFGFIWSFDQPKA